MSDDGYKGRWLSSQDTMPVSREEDTCFISHVHQVRAGHLVDKNFLVRGQYELQDSTNPYTQQLPLNSKGYARLAILPHSILERERIWDEYLKGEHSLVRR